MEPIHDFQEIEKYEKKIEEQHIIILLLIQPSDKNAGEYISKFNYWNYLSDKYCSIYLLGYSKAFNGKYKDVINVQGVNNSTFEYSDCCFIKMCDQLSKRLKNWSYSGEPELFVLQKNTNKYAKSSLDFSSYNYIDVNYGIEHEYIDSISRFMKRLIDASKSEVESKKVLSNAERLKVTPRRILEQAFESSNKLPKPVKKIINDKLFLKSYKSKR